MRIGSQWLLGSRRHRERSEAISSEEEIASGAMPPRNDRLRVGFAMTKETNTVGEVRRVIIDTDPGIDDTMAIMLALASPELRVEGLTTVRGNVGVEQCARTALTILEIAGHADIPVAVGADKPLSRPYHGHGSTVHGQDGLGETGLSGARPVPDRRAVDFLISRITASPGELTLIALGPLTNLALAVSVDPRLPRRVREVIVMGGAVATRGNATPVAEANINNDPEAARIVFHAGWPVTLVGLDVTHKVTMTPAYLQRLAAAHTDRKSV